MCFRALQLKVWRADHSVSGCEVFTLLACLCNHHLVRCCYGQVKSCNTARTGPWQCVCHMRLQEGPSSMPSSLHRQNRLSDGCILEQSGQVGIAALSAAQAKWVSIHDRHITRAAWRAG